jgi:2-hydroxychromene-2-carboxylate isomerase
MPEIEYFYSAQSSYAYLGSARFRSICAQAGRCIVHRPIDLDVVVPAAGSSEFSQRSDAFRTYFFNREVQRWSEFRQVPIKGRPTYHHHDVTLANCMLIAATERALDVDALTHAVMEAHWRYDADLADRETLRRVAESAGYDAVALLDEATLLPARSTYAANNAQAIERSVFGSPTYFLDGDMFYGQDRLELLERALIAPFRRAWSGE